MAATNCNILNIAHSLVVGKKYGVHTNTTELNIAFVKAYIQQLGCIDLSDCIPFIEPCNMEQDSSCSDFVNPGFGFQQQSLGVNIDFIVNESSLNGQLPYSYVWEYNPTRFEIRTPSTIDQPRIELRKVNSSYSDMNYVTNVTVTVTDANGCTHTKTCQFTYVKINNISQGSVECDEDDFVQCTPANMTLETTNNTITISWTDVGLQYGISVISSSDTTIYTEEYVRSPLTITGVSPGTSFTVYLKTYCPDGTIDQEDEGGETTDSPYALLTCSGITIEKEDIYLGYPYTGKLKIPYTAGNGLAYSVQSFNSNGLSYTLPAGTLNVGAGSLTYNISGTPSADIDIDLTLFGNTCSFDFDIDNCTAPLSIDVEIGEYNSVTGLYPVTLTWPAVAGATQYNLTINDETFVVTGTTYSFGVEPSTEFSGSLSTRCNPTVQSEQIPFEGETPEEPQSCILTDFTYTVTGSTITITGLVPALGPGETYSWTAVRTGGGYSPSGTTGTIPFTITNLTAGEFTVTVIKNCNDGSSTAPVIKVFPVADI